MNLSDQVCSLELATRLKELGVKQESLVYWLNIQHCVHMKVKENGWEVETDENGNGIIDKIDYRIELGNPFAWNVDKDNYWSAFTVAELGEMLPAYLDHPDEDDQSIMLMCLKDDCGWDVSYSHQYYNFSEKNEANARAKMLIYLIKNKLMEVPK